MLRQEHFLFDERIKPAGLISRRKIKNESHAAGGTTSFGLSDPPKEIMSLRIIPAGSQNKRCRIQKLYDIFSLELFSPETLFILPGNSGYCLGLGGLSSLSFRYARIKDGEGASLGSSKNFPILSAFVLSHSLNSLFIASV